MAYAAANGLCMYYEIHGDGPPLLLLHGGSGSISEKWIPSFTPHFQVVAPEQMGHGRTADLVDRPFHYQDDPGAQLCVVPNAGAGRCPKKKPPARSSERARQATFPHLAH